MMALKKNTEIFDDFVERLEIVAEINKHAHSLNDGDFDNEMLTKFFCQGTLLRLCTQTELYFKKLGVFTFNQIQAKEITLIELPNNFLYRILLKNDVDNLVAEHNKNNFEKILKYSFEIANTEFDNKYNENIINNFYNNFINKKTILSIESIDDYFKKFGYMEFFPNMKRKLKKNYNEIVFKYESMIQLRNSITHEDNDVSILPNEIDDYIKNVKQFCMYTDEIFSNWCDKHFCSIR